MHNIKLLATQFRAAIEKALDEGQFDDDTTFRKFPEGCCGDTSDLLAQFLLEKGIETYYICGTYRDGSFEGCQSHAWLETKNHLIVDITGDQFHTNPVFLCYNKPVYVGRKDRFHKLFEVEDRDIRWFTGICTMANSCQPRLLNLYRIIIKYL